MVVASDTVGRKKKLVEDSHVLIERLKKLRALNADPRLVGIDPRMRRTDRNFVVVKTSVR